MLIGVFKSNQRTINLFVILITIVLWLPLFFSDTVQSIDSLFKTIIEVKWLNYLMAVFIVSAEAIYLNYIVNEFKLIKRDTHLTALLFVVLNGATITTLSITPILVVNGLMLIVLHQLFLIYSLKKAYSISFNTSLLIGLSVLVYPPSVVLFPLIWITLLYTKTAVWREFVISLLGFIVPIIYTVTYYFVSDQTININQSIFKSTYSLSNFDNWTMYNWSYFITIAAIIFIGGVVFIACMNNSVVKIRKHLLTVLFMLIICCLTVFINKNDYISTYLLAITPLSIILANFFNEIKKKWLSELLFLFIIGTIIVGYFS